MADNTGTNNATYNLVSVLYHALQGADLYEKYANDAGGDQDLADFFREVQQQEKQRHQQRQWLQRRKMVRKRANGSLVLTTSISFPPTAPS